MLDRNPVGHAIFEIVAVHGWPFVTELFYPADLTPLIRVVRWREGVGKLPLKPAITAPQFSFHHSFPTI